MIKTLAAFTIFGLTALSGVANAQITGNTTKPVNDMNPASNTKPVNNESSTLNGKAGRYQEIPVSENCVLIHDRGGPAGSAQTHLVCGRPSKDDASPVGSDHKK